MSKHLFIAITLISLLTLSFNASSDNGYSVKQISPGVYYHQGLHEDASESNIGAIANVGFIIGEQCIAVIDSGGSYLEGTYLRQAIRKHSNLPICYVINTHSHPDHILGNAAFKQDQPDYIGHDKLAAAIESRQGHFAKTFKQALGSAYDGTEFIKPNIGVTVDKPLIVDLGNRHLTLTAYATSHTDHDISVFDQQSKTLWTGDLLFIDRIPVLDGSLNGWLATMQQLKTLSPSYVVPGHGTASSDQWQQGLNAQIRYFTGLRDEIRVIINDLGTIEQASQQVGLHEEQHWELFQHYHRRNITASFVQLEWE